jgi:hypothetical protein
MVEEKSMLEVLNLNSDSIEITKNAKGTYQYSVKKYGKNFDQMLTEIEAIIGVIETKFKSD